MDRPVPEDRLEEQAARHDRSTRGALLRREGRDLDQMAQDSDLPTDLLRTAHQARMEAVASDPGLSTVAETELIVRVVLAQMDVPPAPEPEFEGPKAFRRAAVESLLADLELPVARNATQLEMAAKMRLALRKMI